jgi:hypothetical protein
VGLRKTAQLLINLIRIRRLKMTVQTLIDELGKVTDKSKNVKTVEFSSDGIRLYDVDEVIEQTDEVVLNWAGPE